VALIGGGKVVVGGFAGLSSLQPCAKSERRRGGGKGSGRGQAEGPGGEDKPGGG
jgi:hypothetical protein